MLLDGEKLNVWQTPVHGKVFTPFLINILQQESQVTVALLSVCAMYMMQRGWHSDTGLAFTLVPVLFQDN